MPMREECKQFESRTYPNGETVRKCNLDLAPEAPWRCPDNCPKYERRLVDVNWSHGTLVTPKTPDEPVDLDVYGNDVAALLDEAEDIVNAAGADLRDEQSATQRRNDRGGDEDEELGATRLYSFRGGMRDRENGCDP